MRIGTKIAATTAARVLVDVGVAAAHDLFLKPQQYFLPERASVLIRVLNGTFVRSENSIARDRVLDVSVVSPDGRSRLDTASWSVAGDTSWFRVQTGATGTYLLGASTRPSIIAMTAAEFNEYLRGDGVPDVLAARRHERSPDKQVRERYHKHVKAVIQVGETRTDHFAAPLGYAAEIIPLENPYTLRRGDVLRVRTLVNGAPVVNQFLLFGGRTSSGGRIPQRSTRSDSNGVARVPLQLNGTWYLKFIHMTRLERDTVDYESRWASLVFQVR
ncbi:MAG: DUF4198 domain-containing protein [Gemmatimonadaceae bacterium]